MTENRRRYSLTHSNKILEEEVFDISTFLWNFRFLLILSRPFIQTVQFVRDVLRWKKKSLSGSVWLTINACCLFVPAENSMTLCLLGLSLLAGFGIIQRKTNVFIKFFPNNSQLDDNGLYACMLRDAGSTAELLKEYRKVLLRLNYLLEKSWELFDDFYSILKCDDLNKSSAYFACVCVVIIMLHLYDLRWLIFLTTNFLFLARPNIYCGIMEQHLAHPIKCPKEQILQEMTDYEDPVEQPLVNQMEKLDPDTESPYELEELSSAEEDDILYSDLKLEQQPANKTTMVKRLLDLRKKHQQANAGNCTNCGVNFTSFLKRRHPCTNCGKHFCSRCCCFKVPKALFGATAPTAKTETVLVCSNCNDFLMAKDPL